MKDLFGKAILDFQIKNNSHPLLTETDISEQDEMDMQHLFRTYKDMPPLEKKALLLAKGKTLDVGCGAGAHTLYLQEKGFDVLGLDKSYNSIEACQKRGVKQAIAADILEFKEGNYDTILLLMNGTGIFGYLKNISKYLQHLRSLLTDTGQILIDSSDLIYMFDTDEDGGVWIPMENKEYYGELMFTITYKGEVEEFPWLYLDFNTLQNAAHANGLNCELIVEGDNYDYLAKLTIL